MHHVMSQLRRNQDERSLTAGQKWTLPPCGQPISLFNGSSEGRRLMRATDDSEFICEASRTAFRAYSFSYVVWVQFKELVTTLCHQKVQEVLSLCLPWRHMWESRYSSTNSWLQRWMEVSGQSQAQVAYTTMCSNLQEQLLPTCNQEVPFSHIACDKHYPK